ncbi:alpha/beta hydrolase [Oceanibacterium hippocampi]|uniref:Carboxylesterase NlhH n=1 Tax=Oceanibacterium hippocampi TaxID=745714 RepID=A0A1Y5TUP0_9PROT|nr:alpha/beta hydrolase [Oceanibacterium hippocampi]SLN73046.1 Carboxylesterase NlhH [Oceanibacterium hippocampi]
MTILRLRPLIPAVLAFALLLSACSPLGMLDAIVPNEGYRLETGIAYGDGPRRKLDLYHPVAGDSDTVIIFFYGGSWKRGERADYRFVGQALAAAGFTVVIPDYRLYPEVRFPAFMDDAARAVAWTRRHLVATGRDPDRIVLAGHSAGAHIAALLALNPRYLAAEAVPRTAIAGLVGLAGPYASYMQDYDSVKAVFAGIPKDGSRPYDFVNAEAPPTLLLHGTGDDTVYPQNSEELAKALRALGVPVVYRPIADIGHARILMDIAEPFRNDRTFAAIVDFAGNSGPRLASGARVGD